MKGRKSHIAAQIVADYKREKEWREAKERLDKIKKGEMENKNGNAIYEVVRQWVEQKK